jgi:uncharacterized membrane protein YcaP (DUF421 family)
MVGPDSTLGGGLVAACTLFLGNYLLKYLQYHYQKFGKILQGDATMLVYQGKMIKSHMEKVKISYDELMEAVREHGVVSIKDVDLAILEVDGSISVLSEKFQKKSVTRRKTRKNESKQLI